MIDFYPPPTYVPVTAQCIAYAAREYRVPALLISAVTHVEGGIVGKASKNSNGTFDYGPMQINSLWVKELKMYGVAPANLMWDGCLNTRIGAWRIASEIRRVNGDIWRGVGNYHSRSPERSRAYAEKVRKKYVELDLMLKNYGKFIIAGNMY